MACIIRYVIVAVVVCCGSSPKKFLFLNLMAPRVDPEAKGASSEAAFVALVKRLEEKEENLYEKRPCS